MCILHCMILLFIALEDVSYLLIAVSLQAFKYSHFASWWKSTVWFCDVRNSLAVDQFIVIFFPFN